MSDSLRSMAAAALREARETVDVPSVAPWGGSMTVLTTLSFTVGAAEAQMLEESRVLTERALDPARHVELGAIDVVEAGPLAAGKDD